MAGVAAMLVPALMLTSPAQAASHHQASARLPPAAVRHVGGPHARAANVTLPGSFRPRAQLRLRAKVLGDSAAQ
jgi:hypothetical protein